MDFKISSNQSIFIGLSRFFRLIFLRLRTTETCFTLKKINLRKKYENNIFENIKVILKNMLVICKIKLRILKEHKLYQDMRKCSLMHNKIKKNMIKRTGLKI